MCHTGLPFSLICSPAYLSPFPAHLEQQHLPFLSVLENDSCPQSLNYSIWSQVLSCCDLLIWRLCDLPSRTVHNQYVEQAITMVGVEVSGVIVLSHQISVDRLPPWAGLCFVYKLNSQVALQDRLFPAEKKTPGGGNKRPKPEILIKVYWWYHPTASSYCTSECLNPISQLPLCCSVTEKDKNISLST